MIKKPYKTLLERLESRAVKTPGKIAFTFFQNPPCSCNHLWREIDNAAIFLQARGLKPKDRVILIIPNSSLFFYVFFGVQRAGGIAVPVFPGSGSERIIKLADLCTAGFIVVSKNIPPEKIRELKEKPGIGDRKLLFVDDHFPDRGQALFPQINPGDVSFIQFTSGSTGNPKGVQLTHANLVANIEQMTAGLNISDRDSFVSWLPVYHDMGLILMTMLPLYHGIDFVLLPTGLNFIKTWLKIMSERKATFTAAPDFAYRLSLIYIRNPEEYDLSNLRVALNAAEPVRFSTINKFQQKFHLKNVMLPAYGLAEATVGVCGWQPGQEVKVDKKGIVSVGKPFPGVTMRIVTAGKPADPGEIGEILVRSRATTCGYFNNPQETSELFAEENYIATGDLGYFDESGDYYIVGRKKNIIIHGGHNIAAREVEELVDEFPFVRHSAAIGIDRGGTEGEQVYIFIEVRLKKSQVQNEKSLMDLIIDITEKFKRHFGFRPGRVYLLKPRSLPMTFNGKFIYPLLKELYLTKKLEKNERILFPQY